jgi:Fur family ferric uptake transcriptional regulator
MQVNLNNALRAKGYSATKSRQIVFSALLREGALSIRTLVHITEGSLDRASVYRTVRLFEELGFIRRITIGWKYKIELSDIFTHHHHHITCDSCGLVTDLEDDARLEHALGAMTRTIGFSNLHHEVEIRGICQACQKNGAPVKN